MDGRRQYIAIDLKSFYASVECVDRGLDPLTTFLVVADNSRTDKTICLAVSPALKAYGVPGRPRLFEVVQKVAGINALRRRHAPGGQFTGSTTNALELDSNPALALDYIVACPRMARYMACSTAVYQIYLRHIAPEDIHVYSVDEVFMDVTRYLPTLGISAHTLAIKMIREVLNETGITATAGIGTNLYLAKVAMDIVAKHLPADKDGVRIAQLDEQSYREMLWEHQPITDFWRVGRGIAKKLAAYGLHTMGDIALCSAAPPSCPQNEELLYRLLGVNAELLIDHAWGVEPCTIADIKSYRPQSNSLGSGQVLSCPYPAEKGLLIAREMTDLLVLDLVDKGLVTDQMVLHVGYDMENLNDPARAGQYRGPVVIDFYGRPVPRPAHGSIQLGGFTSSSRRILQAVSQLYQQVVDPALLVRRVNITALHITPEENAPAGVPEQMDLFGDWDAAQSQRQAEQRERRQQKAVLHIQKRFGKNAILKGMNLEEGAMTRERNRQIGGHKA